MSPDSTPAAESEKVIPHSNEVFAIEVRGFDHIPEPERNMTLRHVDYLWVGTSVNLLTFALGALAITLGLSLWLAFAACLTGTLIYAYLAFGSILTTRAGLPVSMLARAAFGTRGNLPNAVLSWLASVAFEVINTIFGVDALLALFDITGWQHSGRPASCWQCCCSWFCVAASPSSDMPPWCGFSGCSRFWSALRCCW